MRLVETEMLRAKVVLLVCLFATEGHGESDRNALFQSAYCVGAIIESRRRALNTCVERFGKETDGVAACHELWAPDDEMKLVRLQRHILFIGQHPAAGDAAIAEDLRGLAALGRTHFRSGELAEFPFYERCIRDCLIWPPTEGCAERAR